MTVREWPGQLSQFLRCLIKLVFTFVEPVWSTVKNRPYIIPSSCYLPCLLLWHFDFTHFSTSCVFVSRNYITVSSIWFLHEISAIASGGSNWNCFFINTFKLNDSKHILWFFILSSVVEVISPYSCYLLSHFINQLFILQFEIWSSIVSSALFFLLLSWQ